MYARTAESNKWGANLHIPIHTNAYNKKVQGTRIYCYNTTGEGYKASKAIMSTLNPITPGSSDSINARDNLYEINKANAPVAYIEVAFHDNEVEAKWVIENTEAIAEAICKGICNHYGVKYIAPVAEPSPDPKEKYIYRVQVGCYSKRSGAEKMLSDLRVAGFGGIIVKSEK
jgi:hemolysin-activating ACP:hemolysin acyltransferase